jgi:hypothetical protein
MSKKNLPSDFIPSEYLNLHPDLILAGIDPEWHYINYGRQEGRSYKKAKNSLAPKIESPYNNDGLRCIHNHDFMIDPEFTTPYKRGMQAAGEDYGWYWRVHIGLWAARSAFRIDGDFIECGVNRGFLSSAIMNALDWDKSGRIFYLLDTFGGLDDRFVSEEEKIAGVMDRNKRDINSGFYTKNLSEVEKNFSEWKNIKIVAGSIPETLDRVVSEKIAFLHIDLNCALPEIAAIEHFWNRIQLGGIVLLDDYAYYGYQSQKDEMDAWSKRTGVPIASLPTGQGLIVKT